MSFNISVLFPTVQVKNIFEICMFLWLNFICLSVFSQKTLQNIERDKYYSFNELLSQNSLNDIDVKIKFGPSYPNNGCTTQNTISFLIEGYLRYITTFLSFDIYYKDCNENLYFKTISIPLSRNEFTKYLNIPTSNQSRYSNVLGYDNNNIYNNDFNFFAENIAKVSNVRLTDTYVASAPKRELQLEKPQRINISNEPGEENTKSDRAEFKSRLSLSISGGRLPSQGVWTWYADKDQRYPIGRGVSIIYDISTEDPEILISVVGSTNDGKSSTDPLSRKLYVEVKQIILSKIDKLILSNDLDQALELITKLKNSYYNDNSITNKYNQIIALVDKKVKEEEKKRLKEFFSKDYNLAVNFPLQNREMKSSIYNLFNNKLFSGELDDGKYIVDIGLEYKMDDRYYFKSNNSFNKFNSYLVENLNAQQKKFKPPTLLSPENKYVEVNAYGNFYHSIEIQTTKYKFDKKNGAWVSNDIFLQKILTKRYNSILNDLTEGKYGLNIKKVSLDGIDYFQTSGYIIKRKDGPNNVFKSILIPSLGRKSVGLKNGNLITFSIVGLTAISVLSKIYSNREYNKFLQANDQTTLDRSYQNASIANRTHLISAGIGITFYSYNLLSVYVKGKRNKRNNLYSDLPFIKDNIIAY